MQKSSKIGLVTGIILVIILVIMTLKLIQGDDSNMKNMPGMGSNSASKQMERAKK